MNSAIAAIIAVVVGALVAFYLYFYKNEEPVPNWTLALLRFGWTGLLVYAIFAPDAIRENKRLRPQVIVSLLDTSRSVDGNVRAVYQELANQISGPAIQWIDRAYSEQNIPADMPWVYIGDGHIPTPQEAHAPHGAILLPAKGLDPTQLIYGVSVTKLATTGTAIPYEIQCEEGADVEVRWNNTVVSTKQGVLRAPQTPGNYLLETFATKNGRKDTLNTWVQVADNLRTIAFVAASAHPHEMMVRRWAKKRHYALVPFKNIVKAKESGIAPMIVVGEKPGEMPEGALWLSGSLPMDFEQIKRLNAKQIVASSKVDGPVVLSYAEHWTKSEEYDFTGVHWYKSALMDENAGMLFEEVLDGFVNEYSDIHPTLSGPQRLYSGARSRWISALLSGDNVPQPSDVSVVVLQEGSVVDRPLSSNVSGPAVQFSVVFPSEGTYRIQVTHSANGKVYELEELVTVEKGDAESKIPLNTDLLNQWSKEAWILSSDSISSINTEDFLDADQWISIREKNPQHAHWWYWGFALLLAASEWLLRRRQGLI